MARKKTPPEYGLSPCSGSSSALVAQQAPSWKPSACVIEMAAIRIDIQAPLSLLASETVKTQSVSIHDDDSLQGRGDAASSRFRPFTYGIV